MAVAVQSDALSGMARALGRITPVAGQLHFMEQVGGARLITAVAANGDTDLTRRWLRGEELPQAEAGICLRDAFAAAWLLSHHLSVEAVAQWFRTRDVRLGDTPVLALRRGRGGELLDAARAAVGALGAPSQTPPFLSCGGH